MKNFFLMTRGRTGSSAIIDELSKVNKVRSTAVELFLKWDFEKVLRKHPKSRENLNLMKPFELWKRQRPWWKRIVSYYTSEKEQINGYLAELETTAARKGNELFGFKVLSHHFEETPPLREILHERRYRAIYLKRNVPRQVLSGMIAKQRGIYNTKADYEDDNRYRIDMAEFRELVGWEQECVKRDVEFLKSERFDFIEVSYEDFMSNREDFFGRVFRFLEMQAKVPEVSSYSIMIKDLQYTVENYSDVVESVAAMGMTIE